jgi:uncharacterized protein with HEPN domain
LKADYILLAHIQKEIAFLSKISRGRTLDDLVRDDYFAHAVKSAIEVIGEAAKNISPGLKDNHPEIEWRRMARMRDRIIHHYFDINWKIVWDVISIEIPALEPKISAIIQELESGM